MGKKRGGSKGTPIRSKGERPSVSKSLCKDCRKDYTGHKQAKALRVTYLATAGRSLNQIAAWEKGKRVMLTIPNPNTEETNRPYIRVNANELWGSPKSKRNAGYSF